MSPTQKLGVKRLMEQAGQSKKLLGQAWLVTVRSEKEKRQERKKRKLRGVHAGLRIK